MITQKQRNKQILQSLCLMISLKRLQFMKQRMAEQKTILSKWIFISISLEILFFHLVRMKWKPCSQRKHAERKRLLKERENLLRNLRRKEIQKRAEIKAKTEAGDPEAMAEYKAILEKGRQNNRKRSEKMRELRMSDPEYRAKMEEKERLALEREKKRQERATKKKKIALAE